MTLLGSCQAPASTFKSGMLRNFRLLVLFALPASADWEVKPLVDGLAIHEDGQRGTRCHLSPVPCLYPLPSASGANLARRWPLEEAAAGEEKDHPHHRSLWLAHGDVNGFDFWAWTGKGDPKIRTRATRDVVADAEHAAFTLDLEWVAGDQIQVTEERRHTLRRPDPRTLWIEIDSRIRPAGEQAVFGDTKEGTFALRVDRSLRLKGPMAKGHILDSEGRTDDACWGKRAKWVAFHGPDEKGEPAVLAILDHPQNLRHPTWWHARDYGLLAANPFGIHDFESKPDRTLGRHVLKKGEELRQRYLVVLHHGSVEDAKLGDAWSQFSK